MEGDVVEDEDDDDEIGKGSGSDESMMMEATDEASVVKKYRVRASYKKQLMLSEWMEVRTARAQYSNSVKPRFKRYIRVQTVSAQCCL